MKKGFGYVDLVISVGIFIIYILSIFIFFKPGIQEEYNPTYLNTIIEQSLKKDLYWQVEKMPIFINSFLLLGVEGNKKFELEFPFNNWQNNANLYDSDLNEIGFQFDNPNKLIFETYIKKGFNKKTFYITHSSEISNPPLLSGTTLTTQFIYKYGVKENLYGINGQNLTDYLNNIDYNTLKNNWHYPTTKNFQISITNIEGTILSEVNSNISPPKESEVSVLRWNDFILDKSGERTQVIVNIKTW